MKKKILIVDDEPGVRHILSSSVRNLGYDVIEAEDGEQAIEKIESEIPDLVLLDLLMPIKNGFEVLDEIKVKRNSLMPFIVLTNYDDPTDIERVKKQGAINYIVKTSMTLKEIMEKIQKVLEI